MLYHFMGFRKDWEGIAISTRKNVDMSKNLGIFGFHAARPLRPRVKVGKEIHREGAHELIALVHRESPVLGILSSKSQ